MLETAIQAISSPTAWSTSTSYTAGDEALGSDGQIYEAIVDNSGNNPVDDSGSNWRLLGPEVDGADVAYSNSRFVITNDNMLLMALPTGTAATAMGLTAATGGERLRRLRSRFHHCRRLQRLRYR